MNILCHWVSYWLDRLLCIWYQVSKMKLHRFGMRSGMCSSCMMMDMLHMSHLNHRYLHYMGHIALW